MKASEVLAELLQNENLTCAGLAKMIGVRAQVFYDVRDGKINITAKRADDILKVLPKYSRAWLLTGEGSMLTADDNIQTDTLHGNDTSVQQAVNVPSISYTHGRPYFNVDFLGGFDIIINDQTVLPEYNIDFKPYNKDGVMWCNITGHSMEPLVSSGDVIAIKEMKDWRDFILYGEVYGIVTEDMRTVKVVTKSEQGRDFMRLVPINKSEEYQPQDIPVKLITHVFKVIGCMKKMW